MRDHTCVGWWIAHILYGSLSAGGLVIGGMFVVLSRPEAADRLTVVVVVVVGHVDAAVEGMEHPMSNFQYCLLFCDLLLFFMANLFSLTGFKELEFLFLWLSFFCSLYSAIFFLMEEKGFSCLLQGLYEVTCRYGCHPPSRWSSPCQPCLWGRNSESSESQSCSVPWGGNPFWKGIYIVLYSFLSIGSQGEPSKSLF